VNLSVIQLALRQYIVTTKTSEISKVANNSCRKYVYSISIHVSDVVNVSSLVEYWRLSLPLPVQETQTEKKCKCRYMLWVGDEHM